MPRTRDENRERMRQRRASQRAEQLAVAGGSVVVRTIDGDELWCASPAVADAFLAELSRQSLAAVARDPGVAALLRSGAVSTGAEMFPRPDGRTDRAAGLPRSTSTVDFVAPIAAGRQVDRDYLLARINRAHEGRPMDGRTTHPPAAGRPGVHRRSRSRP